MLNIRDLATNKALDHNEMAAVAGGHHPWLTLNGSTSLMSKVANISQVFDFQLGQANAGEVTNNQALAGGNGAIYAPVAQSLEQDNQMEIYDVGNTRIG